MSLVSADLYPEIIKSRKLGKLVLYDDFITKKYRKSLKLINILNDTPDGRTEFDDNAIKEALLKLQGMIQIGTKTSPLIDLSITSFEPKLCSDLINSIIKNFEKFVKII